MELTDAANGRIWGILPGHLDALLERFERFNRADLGNAETAARLFGERSEPSRDYYSVIDGVAVIPVTGPIYKRMSFFSSLFGGTGLNHLNAALTAALDDPSARAIVLDFDSPGGTVGGVDAMAARVLAARNQKPIVAYSGATLASAAYWIASSANRIIVDRTAEVGSIGIMTVHYDFSEEDKKYGVKRTFLAAGKYKVLGNDAEPLTDLARQVITDELNTVYSLFVDAVATGRGVDVKKVLSDMADGRVFIGDQSRAAGLADDTGTFDDAIQTALELAGAEKPKFKNGASKMDLTTLKADHKETYQAAFDEGKASVDVAELTAETVKKAAETTMALVTAFFGEEQSEKFKALVDTGVTAEQLAAIRGAIGGTETEPQAGESEEELAAKKAALEALNNSGPENPGPDAVDPGQTFEAAWKTVREERGCSIASAMKVAASRHPELHQQYIESLRSA